MPPSIKKIMLNAKDSNYVEGMNTLDEAKVLHDGEAVEIVNAIPGIPPRMRKGCAGQVLTYSGLPATILYVVSKPFHTTVPSHYGGAAGSIEATFFWAKDRYSQNAHRCYLCYVKHSYASYPAAVPVVYGNNSPVYVDVYNELNDRYGFDFAVVGNIVYARYYSTENRRGKMFAVELFNSGGSFPLKGREIPNSTWNAGLSFSANEFRSELVSQSEATVAGSFAFGYSMTLVRRTDADPGVIHTYAPGTIESTEAVESRAAYWDSDLPDGTPVRLWIKPASLGGIRQNNEWGFTHVRIYRTDNLAGSFDSDAGNRTIRQILNGATRFFLMDVPIEAFYNGLNQLQEVADTTTVGSLQGELNQLSSYNYTFPPADGHKMIYFKDRLFLMGEKGAVFFSEIPGGDGGGDEGYAQTHKDKYALWFKPLINRLDLDVEERTASAGMAALGGDLYLFKENKVYMIIGGDPTAFNAYRTANDKSGCPFPDTITKAMLSGQEVLFYMGNAGPAYITAGGNGRQFTEFKIKEFWPDTGSDLFKGWWEYHDRRDGVQNCAAAFWNNTIWVFLQFGSYVTGTLKETKIFGYVSAGETNGAFEVRLADNAGFSKYQVNNIVITNDNKAVTVGDCIFNNSLKTVFVDFLSNEESYDTLQGGQDAEVVKARPNFTLLSRKIYPGPLERSISELFRVTAYTEFTDDTPEDKPFTLEIRSNRLRTIWDYHDKRGRSWFHSNQLGTPIPIIANRDMITRQDGGTWTPHMLQGYAVYLYNEAAPTNGIWRKVCDNGSSNLAVDVAVGATHTHIRLIAVPSVRLNIDFVPQADFIGEFFQYKLTKAIPGNRKFDWYGVEIQAVPRPQLDIESITGALPSDGTTNHALPSYSNANFNTWE